ncbi:MAG: adenylate/guanylate cyclase domain-containing protein [Acidimicrobiia bacterium]|nr:adenylate/guanylate cyclase domain-containing protein [Acidimicrobiia bacterium]
MSETSAPSEIGYARNGDIHLAFQTLGTGERDVVFDIGGFIPVSLVWDYPPLAAFLRRLSSLGRLIIYDRRGVGFSDPVSRSDPGTTAQLADDLITVLDSCESASATVIAEGFNTAPLIEAAVTSPDRFDGLVLSEPVVRTRRSPDFPYGVAEENSQAIVDAVLGGDESELTSPTPAADRDLRAFLDRAGRLGASPASARAIYLSYGSLDVIHRLHEVTQPTLILWRPDALLLGRPQAEFVADAIPDSKIVALPGIDFFSFAGDTDAVLSEIEEFVTGVRGAAPVDRVLGVMMFTDIVGSTELAAEVGDDQWRSLLDQHDQLLGEALDRFDGVMINEAGDGVLATFPTPSRAIGCAGAFRAALAGIGLSLRAGVHVGEVERRGDDIGGIAVNMASRIMAAAAPGAIYVSDVVPSLVRGSEAAFESVGMLTLRGIPGEHELFRLREQEP